MKRLAASLWRLWVRTRGSGPPQPQYGEDAPMKDAPMKDAPSRRATTAEQRRESRPTAGFRASAPGFWDEVVEYLSGLEIVQYRVMWGGRVMVCVLDLP